jgi:rhodanese-related sulfurtransferase
MVFPVVVLACMTLAWQEPVSPNNEDIGIGSPVNEICTTCPEGPIHKEIPRITIEELKQKMDGGGDIVVLDAQPKAIYDKMHIKGSIPLPWTAKLTQWDVRQIPRDKMIIIYCDCGPGEADSSDLAAQLREMGFNNVEVLAYPSIRGWIRAGYPVEK